MQAFCETHFPTHLSHPAPAPSLTQPTEPPGSPTGVPPFSGFFHHEKAPPSTPHPDFEPHPTRGHSGRPAHRDPGLPPHDDSIPTMGHHQTAGVEELDASGTTPHPALSRRKGFFFHGAGPFGIGGGGSPTPRSPAGYSSLPSRKRRRVPRTRWSPCGARPLTSQTLRRLA